MTDLERLKDWIMTAQVATENGECLMPNITDVLNEIERLQALSIPDDVGQSEQLVCRYCGSKHLLKDNWCDDCGRLNRPLAT